MRVASLALVAILGVVAAPARADLLGNLVNSFMESVLYGDSDESPAPAPAPDPRGIPDDALEGVMSPPEGRVVTIDDEEMRLAPGCRIFDGHNRSVLPATVRESVPVRYTLDQYDQVQRVWMLASR